MQNGNDRGGSGHTSQITTTSRVRPTNSDGESLVFEINLALLTLVCVAIIPDEGTNEAPVYIHFKLNSRPRVPKTPVERKRFRTERRPDQVDAR